ncbi:MAG: trypsin-like peptidase domain-containing protein [Candidatus Doudnabacteria bacterium]|nr:trypsin-like peptidase domain-containing protein [Candidatus Doudnabacteria bacterium]
MGLVVLLSFLFGIAGAVFGATFFSKNGISLNSFGEVKTVKVDENSAVVDVVKKSSPAVVSIIISKDLSKIPGYSTSPFDFGPFGLDPFYQNRNQSGTPNIQEVGGGSGFIITQDGLIMTNKHVVEDAAATYTVLTNDGKKYEAQVLSRDPVNDLALVKIKADNLPTLSLGDSSHLEIGQKVIAIGNSLGQYQNTVTTGVVSGIGRTITASGTTTGSEQLEGVIQTDAAINPGNSGGPLLDIGGSVIGINTAIDSQGQLVGFAIPVNDIKKDVEVFQRTGKITKPFLGVRYVLVNQSIKEENKLSVDYGALIVSGGTPGNPAVLPGSAADKAGLREGDIILEVNGQQINQSNSLAKMMKNFGPGEQVRMKILSRDQTKDITLTLGESK